LGPGSPFKAVPAVCDANIYNVRARVCETVLSYTPWNAVPATMAEFKRAEVRATTIAVTCLAGVFVILRFVARYMTVRTNLATDDWLIVVAIVRSPPRLPTSPGMLILIDTDDMQHGGQPHEYRP